MSRWPETLQEPFWLGLSEQRIRPEEYFFIRPGSHGHFTMDTVQWRYGLSQQLQTSSAVVWHCRNSRQGNSQKTHTAGRPILELDINHTAGRSILDISGRTADEDVRLSVPIVFILWPKQEKHFQYQTKGPTTKTGMVQHTDPWLSQGAWWSAYRFMHFCWSSIAKDQLPGL